MASLFTDRRLGRCRTVKMFSSSRLIMNSRQLWNSNQRHKFLRAQVSRDILKFGVLEMAFPGVFKRYFHCGCYVVLSEYTQDWEQCHRNVAGTTLHRVVRTFYRSKPVQICVQCHSKLEHACFTILFDGAYFFVSS